jgi:ABC-type phosphate transport system permease subunit
MDFQKMTKQQLKEYGETIGVKLNLKNKKDVLIEELNNATKKESVINNTSNETTQTDFDTKQYIWLIVFVLLIGLTLNMLLEL